MQIGLGNKLFQNSYFRWSNIQKSYTFKNEYRFESSIKEHNKLKNTL